MEKELVKALALKIQKITHTGMSYIQDKHNETNHDYVVTNNNNQNMEVAIMGARAVRSLRTILVKDVKEWTSDECRHVFYNMDYGPGTATPDELRRLYPLDCRWLTMERFIQMKEFVKQEIDRELGKQKGGMMPW